MADRKEYLKKYMKEWRKENPNYQKDFYHKTKQVWFDSGSKQERERILKIIDTFYIPKDWKARCLIRNTFNLLKNEISK